MSIPILYVFGGFLKYRLMFVLLLGVGLVGCGGQSGGIAPSHPNNNLPTLVIDTADQSNFKYGETQTTSNQWEVSIDTTDPVENVTLSNGWNVEVKYE
jgi:hypothetical protein